MQVRRFKESDKDIVEKWCRDWKFPLWDWSICPQDSAFIVEINGKPVALSWYVRTNCSSSILGWTVSSKDIDKYEREEAVNILLSRIFYESKKDGYEYIYYSTDSHGKNMMRNFEKQGATITSNGDAYIGFLSFNNSDIGFME